MCRSLIVQHKQHAEAELAAAKAAQQAAEQAQEEAAQRAQHLEGELQQAQQGAAAAQAELEAERAQREVSEKELVEERRARAEADEGRAAAALQVCGGGRGLEHALGYDVLAADACRQVAVMMCLSLTGSWSVPQRHLATAGCFAGFLIWMV